MPEYVTQSEYARRRGVVPSTVFRRTVTAGGPIRLHGARRLICVEEADALWTSTVAAQGITVAEGAALTPKAVNGHGARAGKRLVEARVESIAVDVEAKRLAIAQRRGTLIPRDRATTKAFAFARLLRDAWLSWPARVGPLVAAAVNVDAGTVTVLLETHVREHLADLASERVEF